MNNLSFPVLEILGIIAFALSGISVAKSTGLDLVGTYFCALLTALGGGTVRDVLIDHRPFYWVQHEWLLVFILLLVVGSYAKFTQPLYGPFTMLTRTADSVGTGIFALTGLTLAISKGFNPVAAILMSLVTAIVGGVMRDIICGQIPYAFKRSELCATCALAGCLVYFTLQVLAVPFLLAFTIGALVAGLLRYFALAKGIMLPW